MKTKQFDYENDTNIVLVAEIDREGIIHDFSVILYINGIDHDITKGFTEERLKDFEQYYMFKLDAENESYESAKVDFEIDCARDESLERED
jgi:hypothetical protein